MDKCIHYIIDTVYHVHYHTVSNVCKCKLAIILKYPGYLSEGVVSFATRRNNELTEIVKEIYNI